MLSRPLPPPDVTAGRSQSALNNKKSPVNSIVRVWTSAVMHLPPRIKPAGCCRCAAAACTIALLAVMATASGPGAAQGSSAAWTAGHAAVQPGSKQRGAAARRAPGGGAHQAMMAMQHQHQRPGMGSQRQNAVLRQQQGGRLQADEASSHEHAGASAAGAGSTQQRQAGRRGRQLAQRRRGRRGGRGASGIVAVEPTRARDLQARLGSFAPGVRPARC